MCVNIYLMYYINMLYLYNIYIIQYISEKEPDLGLSVYIFY